MSPQATPNLFNPLHLSSVRKPSLPAESSNQLSSTYSRCLFNLAPSSPCGLAARHALIRPRKSVNHLGFSAVPLPSSFLLAVLRLNCRVCKCKVCRVALPQDWVAARPTAYMYIVQLSPIQATHGKHWPGFPTALGQHVNKCNAWRGGCGRLFGPRRTKRLLTSQRIVIRRRTGGEYPRQ